MLNWIFVLSFILCTQVSASSYSQNKKIDLDLRKVKLKEALSVLENKGNFRLLYSEEDLPLDKSITLTQKGIFVYDALNILVKGTGMKIQVMNDNLVVIRPEKAFILVKGTVTDDKGLGIPGVSVKLKDGTTASMTDLAGKYSIKVPENGTLLFSYLGYISQEIAVDNQTVINVKLKENSQALSEIVVVGYGTQKKAVVSGAVASVKGSELAKTPTVNLSNSLAGRLPGVTALQSSGEPGYDGSTIRIRGVNSLGNNDALIVIDGVPNRAGGLERINPNDVESVSVLKDASAAIYGSRAANGVILITTKQGKSGKPQLSYDFGYGLQQPTRTPKMASSSQYAEILNELNIFGADLPSSQWNAAWQGFKSTGSYQRTDNGNVLTAAYRPDEMQKLRDGSDPLRYPNTDWFGTTLKTWSPQQRHNLQLTGGAENIKYLVSLGYLDQDGYYKKSATGYQQYDMRINLEAAVSKYVTLTLGVTGREEVRNYPTVGAGDIFRMLMRGKPTEQEVWPNGLPGPDIEFGYNPYVITTSLTGYNRDRRDYFQSTGKIDIKVPGVEGLKITGTASIDKFAGRQKNWQTPWTLYYWDKKSFEADGVTPILTGTVRSPRTDASLSETAGAQLAVNLMGMANYDKKIGDHTFNLMAGVTREKVTNDGFSASRRYFLSTALQELLAGSDKEQTVGNPTDGPNNLFNRARLSYFGRAGYNYKEKYIAEFLWRLDGSYIFPEDKRFGFFPGVSAGWRVSEEPFFKNNIKFINNLKIRASWGQMGAEAYFGSALAEYQYLSTMGFGNYVINNQYSQTLSENRVPNLDFGWEVANNANIGLDASFLNSKLSLEFDYFYNKRTKILISRGNSIPGSSGITDKLPPVNLGKVNNKGFEFKLSYNDRIGELGYGLSVNGGYSKNKIVFWDETPGAPAWQRSTGMPTGTDLIYQYIGVFKDQAEIDANKIDYSAFTSKLRPGDMKFMDVNGDGKIDGNDQIRSDKTSTPTFTGGFNLSLQYKNFDFSALIQGATGGVQIVGLTESGDIGNFLEWSYKNRWSIDNPSSEFPRLSNRGQTYYTDFNIAGRNTYWLRSNNYVRLKNVELGYTLPAAWCKKAGVNGLRVYVNALNLFTFDKIGIWDPESTNSSAQYYPQARVINTGVKVTF
ncbi:SusC/RagA family TonB-linked outer membrane protein [Pedobacter cryoconitis]|uniref:TonB-linked SusC/RagA family outer membrane protein n=1 Tax=Pedobacter cryoconitis TaxID=188932 RepID=A0A7X0J0C2_9SPHI|nr:TonB-dependent receptor [Pedobacter cryoconitis]MBB6498703.1 TonB-linked SusC/RagA family outer membrane protein [Pedobacter cryoconitis]